LKVNRLVIGTLALVLVAGLGTSAFADVTTGNADQEYTDLNFPLGIRPLVDCNVDSGNIVAYENSKGQGTTPVGIWVTDIEANGFVVREVDISSQGIPFCVNQLIVSHLLEIGSSCITTAYNAAETTLITNFVSSGGKLWIMGENTNCGNPLATDLIVSALGATIVSNTLSQTLVASVDFDPNNPATLFQGVNSFSFDGASTYSTPTAGVVASYSGGEPAVIAKEFDSGCVLMQGGINNIRNIDINLLDNRAFVSNAITFLDECNPPVKVGGEFLPIDSTALMLAGLQTSAIWMLPVLAGVAGSAFGVLYIKSRRN